MIESELFCDLSNALLDIEDKMKTLITQLVEKSLPKGYFIRFMVRFDNKVGYRVNIGRYDNEGRTMDKYIICDFVYADKKLEIHTGCVNQFNVCYVYPDKPYHLKCSNAEETFLYDEAKLTETFKIFDSLTEV